MMSVRDNWRIYLLVVLVIASGIVLFVPGATLGGGADDGAPTTGGGSGDAGLNDSIATDGTPTSEGTAAGTPAGETTATDTPGGETQTDGTPDSATPTDDAGADDPVATNVTDDGGLTNLQYGIQLEGGSRIRVPITGMMVDNVSSDANTTALRADLAEELGVPELDVEVRFGEGDRYIVETFNASVSAEQFASALSELGVTWAGDVQNRVSDATRTEMIEVIDEKVSASALSGVTVQGAQTATGQFYVVIESVGRDIADLREILRERGVVDIYATWDDGEQVRHVLDQDDFERVGNVRRIDENRYGVSVTLSEDVAERFQQEMVEIGFTGPTTCPGTGCMRAELNGEFVWEGRIVGNLGESFASGEFANDPTFQMTTNTREDARNLALSLKAGQPLPAPLDFTREQYTFLQPSLAEQFKSNSVLVGLAAVLTVSLVVYYRYRDVRVAAPMVVTALSEVVLLLGFVALVQYPLNLAHIAGFIAVIGTGVDDLVIIADEILQREGVTTGRVFRNRFRKAFWVIGAAAATTILAMSPLMVLSLGDLSGFAIITIVGVLLGIGVTRPAYGDILRNLILDE